MDRACLDDHTGKLFEVEVMTRTNFRMEDENIIMIRGDTVAFGMEIDGLNEDLDFCYFTCKENYTDAENLFQKSLGDGIEKIETGKYSIRIAPEDTKDAEAGMYFYDLTLGVNGDVFTVKNGVFCIKWDVTY